MCSGSSSLDVDVLDIVTLEDVFRQHPLEEVEEQISIAECVWQCVL